MDSSASFGNSRSWFKRSWRWFSARPLWQRYGLGALVLILLVVGITFLRSGGTSEVGDTSPTVSLQSISSLSGGTNTATFVGTVRSESQADLIAQTGGTVTKVNATLGQSVSGGFILAELENASQAAAVLQAEGSYDAAVAAQQSVSPVDTKAAARNAYTAAYGTLGTVLANNIGAFFGGSSVYGLQLIIQAPMYSDGTLSKERTTLASEMDAYREVLPDAQNADPDTLLASARATAQDFSDFLDKLTVATNTFGSGATAAQLSALATARTSISTLIATLTAAQQTYRLQSVTSTASTDAQVTIALGGLRAAQANLEKTRLRAPIAGTVNFFPLHVGDYVDASMHVATIAENGALEVLAYVSEDVSRYLEVGGDVLVGEGAKGVVTSIAPALDPSTKQIEVHIAVDRASGLVNGQSVSLSLQGAAPAATTATTTASVLLPLASVKLGATERDLFSVDTDGRLVAMPVEVGDVVGDRIQILTPLDTALQIVTDARGLSDGEKVNVATTTGLP